VAKRGRPLGSKSWSLNSANIVAHHAKTLLELWLADAPLIDIQALFLPLLRNPEYRALIETCWSERALIQDRLNKRRQGGRPYTVPPKIKRKLCLLTTAHMVEMQRQAQDEKPDTEARLRFSERRAGVEAVLRAEGLSDKKIAAWFAKLAAHRDFTVPDIDKVIEIVNRNTPRITLRKKAADRRILPK
jgi:hypothetical protein